MKRAIFFHSVLIALPAIALCVVGTFFLVREVPKFARVQKQAVTRQYREIAEAMLRDGGLATSHGPRQKGWRQTGKFDKQIPWGHIACETGELVWVGDDAANVAQAVVARPETLDMVAVLYASVIGALFIVVVLSGVGIWYFIRNERERRDFMSATAHDLTTPLVAMGRLIGKDDAYALMLNERMLRLVKNISDFLKLGGKRPQPEYATFSVGSVFFEAYALFADDFAEEQSGPVSVEGDVRLEVYADKLLTLQIVWNLLGNDLKYAAPYGPIALKIGEEGDLVTLSFVDAGQGMTAYQRRHAFDRYYRARTVLQSGKGGFGIGLCTAREFARSMGGDLTVSANAPRGCVFKLSLRKA